MRVFGDFKVDGENDGTGESAGPGRVANRCAAWPSTTPACLPS